MRDEGEEGGYITGAQREATGPEGKRKHSAFGGNLLC